MTKSTHDNDVLTITVRTMATWSRHCFNNHVGIGSRAQYFVDDDVITFLTSDSETTLNWSIITADIYVVKFLYPISIQHVLQQILEMDFRSQHTSVKDSWNLRIHGPENTSGVHWNMDLTRLICYRYCCISNTFFPSWKWQRLVKMISETLYMFIVLWLMVSFFNRLNCLLWYPFSGEMTYYHR